MRIDTTPPTRRSVLLTGAAALLLSAPLPRVLRAEAAPSSVMKADAAYDQARAGKITLIDIRRPEEWAETGIPDGAIALDMTQQEIFLKALVALRKADAKKPIALICRTGNRSGRVIQILAKQGFPGLVDVAEGVAGGPRGKGWKPRGLPTDKAHITEIMTRRDKVLP